MKKLIPVLAAVVLVLGVAAFLAVYLVTWHGAKQKYDDARAELAANVLSEAPMDAETEALLAEVRTNWNERCNDVNGVHADALRTIGMEPTVSNVVEVLTYRMPDYSLFSSDQNERAKGIGLLQAVFLPVSVDRSIYVSGDRHVAMIRAGSSIVLVFEDDAGGLREIQYCADLEEEE